MHHLYSVLIMNICWGGGNLGPNGSRRRTSSTHAGCPMLRPLVYLMICSPRWLLLAIWTPLKTKLSTGGCLTTSEFVCTTEQRDRSREKAREGHRSSLHYVQLCSHAHLIMWLAHCKQQLISCRLQLA